MLGFIVKRMFSLAITMVLISILTFLLMYSVPGGPFDENQQRLEGAQRENIMRKYGMIGPIHERYLNYMNNVLHGDFGYSFFSPTEKVEDLIARVWGPTLTLGGITILLAFPLGIVLGIVAAKNHNKWIDVALNTLATGILGPWIAPYEFDALNVPDAGSSRICDTLLAPMCLGVTFCRALSSPHATRSWSRWSCRWHRCWWGCPWVSWRV